MKQVTVRRWLPALLLFLLQLVSACDDAADGTPSAVTAVVIPATITETVPAVSNAATAEPSVTPLPLISFMGVEFLFDEAQLGEIGTAAYLRPNPPGSFPALPERIEFALSNGNEANTPRLYVFPVQQYAALSADAARHIQLLTSVLDEHPDGHSGDLPFLPMVRAVQSYHSEPVYLQFKNGHGLSYLARADHDHSLATDEELFYTFQGLTDDGRYYVAAVLPVTAASLEDVAENEEENSERRAKSAPGVGWIAALGDGDYSLANEIMLSLRVEPADTFPEITLPDFATAQGFMVAYDAGISGAATVHHVPAVVENPQGGVEYLEGAPDILAIQFAGESVSQEPTLEIQPLKNADGEFYVTIPAWQREMSSALTSGLSGTQSLAATADNVEEIAFFNGRGVRWLTTAAGTDQNRPTPNMPGADHDLSYHFRGISDDGRFLVRMTHQLPELVSAEDAVAYLDEVINSVLISSEVSIEETGPLNTSDCINDAEFITDVSIPDDTVIERGDTFVKIWHIRNSGTCSWTPTYTVRYVEGNPLEWQEMPLTSIVNPGEEVEVAVSVTSPAAAGIYQTWWQLSDGDQAPFGDSLLLRFEAPRAATDIPGYGVIEGHISYPANGNPPVDIYFLRTDGSERFVMQTENGWTRYSRALPVGEYYVFARVTGDASDSGGGYTMAVTCGLHTDCRDHTLLEVVVEEGRAARDVDITDWYAPAGSFPLPDPIVPRTTPTLEGADS